MLEQVSGLTYGGGPPPHQCECAFLLWLTHMLPTPTTPGHALAGAIVNFDTIHAIIVRLMVAPAALMMT